MQCRWLVILIVLIVIVVVCLTFIPGVSPTTAIYAAEYVDGSGVQQSLQASLYRICITTNSGFSPSGCVMHECKVERWRFQSVGGRRESCSLTVTPSLSSGRRGYDHLCVSLWKVVTRPCAPMCYCVVGAGTEVLAPIDPALAELQLGHHLGSAAVAITGGGLVSAMFTVLLWGAVRPAWLLALLITTATAFTGATVCEATAYRVLMWSSAKQAACAAFVGHVTKQQDAGQSMTGDAFGLPTTFGVATGVGGCLAACAIAIIVMAVRKH